MKWSFRIILLATLLLSSCGNPAKSTSGIFGNVVDSDGLPIEGINIAVLQEDKRVDTYSEADGSFSTELPISTNQIGMCK